MAWNERIGGRRGQQVLTGANFAVYTLVVIALIVLVNWFVNHHDKRWDMTPSKKYSLSEQSKKILGGLTKDVNIMVFDQQRRFGERRDVLDMFSKASKRVKVSYIDPDRQPTIAKEYGIRTYGTVVVASGERHVEAQGDTEEGITNALVRVLKGQRTACFIQGHGERNLDGKEREGYDKFKTELGTENYQTHSILLMQMQKPEIPADCTMIVIAGPQNDYLPPEIDAIRTYLQGGGRALVMLDAGVQLPNLTKLMSEWNVTPRNDLVIDQNPVAQLFGTSPAMPIVVKYGSSPIVQPLVNHATLFPLSRSFEVGKSPGASADALCDTSTDSFDVMDFNPKMEKVEFRPGKDLKGPLTLAVAGTIPGQGDKKSARFVALGTSLIAANGFLTFQSNRDFMMNAVNWLSADEDLISIRPTAPEAQHLDMNAQQMGRFLYLGVFGVPLLIIFIGFMVWWQRR